MNQSIQHFLDFQYVFCFFKCVIQAANSFNGVILLHQIELLLHILHCKPTGSNIFHQEVGVSTHIVRNETRVVIKGLCVQLSERLSLLTESLWLEFCVSDVFCCYTFAFISSEVVSNYR